MQIPCHTKPLIDERLMRNDRLDDYSFFAGEAFNWFLNIAIFGLLYLIASKVLINISSLLNLISL
jgi:hypothetical protein